MSSSAVKKEIASLKMIPLMTAIAGIVILLVLQAFSKDPAMIYGCLLGTILVIVNFLFLTKIVVKFLDENYKRKSILGVVLLFKLLFIVGILYYSFKVLHLDVMGFALGYLSLFPAILFYQLKGQQT